jgi:hypothetical protein
MRNLLKAVFLGIALKATQAVNTWKLDIAPRRQWESNSGYCGEVSTISALLNYGGYMS